MSGNLEGVRSADRSGWGKERVNRLRTERHPGVCHGGEATALESERWIQTVTGGGRRFIAVWRKYEVDAARNHQVKREVTRLGTLLSHTEA